MHQNQRSQKMDMTLKLSKIQILWWSADRQFKHLWGDQFQNSKSFCKISSNISKILEKATYFAQTKRSNILNYSHPSLTYGCETWVWTMNEHFDWANTTNKGAAITAVETYCRLTRFRYTGHAERMPVYRIPKMIMHGELDLGQRNLADLVKASSNPWKMIWNALFIGTNMSALVTHLSWTDMNEKTDKQESTTLSTQLAKNKKEHKKDKSGI